jgi:hypothetical protein
MELRATNFLSSRKLNYTYCLFQAIYAHCSNFRNLTLKKL